MNNFMFFSFFFICVNIQGKQHKELKSKMFTDIRIRQNAILSHELHACFDREKSCERAVATGWLQTICFINILHQQYANLTFMDAFIDHTALGI